jgi:hypothetical protein
MWGRLCGYANSVVAIARGSAGIFYRRFSGRGGKKVCKSSLDFEGSFDLPLSTLDF